MSNKNIQQTIFWEFLQNHKIEIPIIQRDYAQGRIGKEKLREKFLIDLKNALDGKFANDEKVLKLDFVYGSVENGCLNPLDGQQRLTTLWLLHWYIAYKAGMLSETKEIFKNFSYETRTSSREFCRKLSDFELKSEDQITDQIQNQTWFLSIWKQDPTIQAMLNMLGGTPIKDNEKNEILDGIEEVFIDCEFSTFVSYFEKLTNKECPIIFYYLDLEGLALSDDLYIKMNARGKPLTSFENFKADLVGFIEENKWDKEKDPKETIAHKLDTDWTNIFWKNRSEKHEIDEVYFVFLNRYFFNSLITAKKGIEKDFYIQKDIESKKLFDYLYGENGKDSRIKYNSFDFYKSEIEILNEKLFQKLSNTLNNFHTVFEKKSKEEINNLFLPSWDKDSSFHFIPEYKEKDGNRYIPGTLTQTERVVFYSICGYFENSQFDEITFKQWMRVVWNIVENANTTQSMIGVMRLIDELKSKSGKIYDYLADSSTVIKSDIAKEQVAEEIEKAKKIVNDTTNTWESKIIEAEKLPFLKGKINILLSYTDINDFNLKLELLTKKITPNNSNTLREMLSYIGNEALPISCKIETFAEWKVFIFSNKIMKDVLDNDFMLRTNDGNWIEWKIYLIEDFDIIKPINCTLRNHNTNGWWGYNKNDVFVYTTSDIRSAKLISNDRKQIISELIKIGIIKNNYPLYPNSNDVGRLWINKDSFTTEFKSKSFNPEQVRLFLDKGNLFLKIWKYSKWNDNTVDKINFEEIVEKIVNSFEVVSN